MIRAVFVLAVACLLVTVGARPLSAMDVEHYRLDLTVSLGAQSIAATAGLTVELTGEEIAAGMFALDLVGLDVTDVRVAGSEAPFSRDEGHLLIESGNSAVAGEMLEVEVDYGGEPTDYVAPWGTWGMVFKEDMVFTVNVTQGARHWFPCHDDVGDKATVELRVTVPEGLTVAAPGQLIAVEQAGAGQNRFEWSVDWPIATYLIHFSAAPYEVVEEVHSGLDFQYYLHPTSWEEAQDTLQHAPQALALWEARYGPYPVPKVAFDEIDLGGAVEQPSCISLGTQIFAADQAFEDVIAHEMAHTWFQGVVTIASWDDLWLSEGLATWHEALYHEHQGGPEAYGTYMESLGLSYRTLAEMSEGYFPLSAPEVLFGVTTYRKGAMVFHMLRYLLGVEAFDELLPAYLEEYAWANVSTGSFRQLVQTETGNPAVGAFFDEWVDGIGYPQFEFAWRASEDGTGAQVLVRQVQPEEWPTFTALPVEVEFRAGEQTARASFELAEREVIDSVALQFEPEEALFDPDRWLLKKVTVVDFPDIPIEALETDVVETALPEQAADAARVEPKGGGKGGTGGCSAAGGGHPVLLLLVLGMCLLLAWGRRSAG